MQTNIYDQVNGSFLKEYKISRVFDICTISFGHPISSTNRFSRLIQEPCAWMHHQTLQSSRSTCTFPAKIELTSLYTGYLLFNQPLSGSFPRNSSLLSQVTRGHPTFVVPFLWEVCIHYGVLYVTNVFTIHIRIFMYDFMPS